MSVFEILNSIVSTVSIPVVVNDVVVDKVLVGPCQLRRQAESFIDHMIVVKSAESANVTVNGTKYSIVFSSNSMAKKGDAYYIETALEKKFRAVFARNFFNDNALINIEGVARYTQTIANVMTKTVPTGIVINSKNTAIVRPLDVIRKVNNGKFFTASNIGVVTTGDMYRVLSATDGACFLNSDIIGVHHAFQARAEAVESTDAIPFKGMVGTTPFSAAAGEYVVDVWGNRKQLRELSCILTTDTVKVNPNGWDSAESFWNNWGTAWELTKMAEEESDLTDRFISTQAIESLNQLPAELRNRAVAELAKNTIAEAQTWADYDHFSSGFGCKLNAAQEDILREASNAAVAKEHTVLGGKPFVEDACYAFMLPDPVFFIEQFSYYADGTRVAETCYYTKDAMGLVHMANEGTECLTGRAARGGMLGVLAAHEKFAPMLSGDRCVALRFPHGNFEWTSSKLVNGMENIMQNNCVYFSCQDDDISILQGDFDGDHCMVFVNDTLSDVVEAAWANAAEYGIHTLVYSHEGSLAKPEIKSAADFQEAVLAFLLRAAESSTIGKYARVVERHNYLAAGSEFDKKCAEHGTFLENKSLDASKKRYDLTPAALLKV